jgi:Domain of unknown function (DUF4397)
MPRPARGRSRRGQVRHETMDTGRDVSSAAVQPALVTGCFVDASRHGHDGTRHGNAGQDTHGIIRGCTLELPMPKLLKSLFVLLALPFVLNGCKINSINYFPATPAQVRIVNVLQTTTPITVTANDVAVWSNLGFEAMTGYQEFTNASTKFSVTLVGESSPLVTQTFNLGGKQNYTFVIYGTVFAPQIGAMADVTSPPQSGKSELNVFMAAPVDNGVALGPYPVDIYMPAPGQPIDNLSPVFTNIIYNLTNIFGQFAAGPYQMIMTVAATKTIIYDSGPITLQDQTSSDLVIYSRNSGMLPNVLLNDADGANQQVILNNKLSRLKVVNSAFQTGAVNQFLNGNPGTANLAYAAAGAYQTVAAGAGTVTFEAAATPGATIATLPVTLVAGVDQTVFVTGFSGATAAVGLTDDNSLPAGGFAAVRFVNSSPDSDPLSVFAGGTVALVTGLATNAASTYQQIPAGATNFTFLDSTNATLVLTLTNVPLVSGQVNTIYVQGPAGALTGLVTPDTP